MSRQPEGRLAARIVERLNREPGCLFRKRHGTGFGFVGEADVTGCVRGRRVEIEVKRPGEAPTPIQLKRLREWAAAGAAVGAATSVEEALAIVRDATPDPLGSDDEPAPPVHPHGPHLADMSR